MHFQSVPLIFRAVYLLIRAGSLFELDGNIVSNVSLCAYIMLGCAGTGIPCIFLFLLSSECLSTLAKWLEIHKEHNTDLFHSRHFYCRHFESGNGGPTEQLMFGAHLQFSSTTSPSESCRSSSATGPPNQSVVGHIWPTQHLSVL